MSGALFSLILFSLFVLAVLGLLLVYARLPVWLKFILIVLVGGFYFVSYHGWKQVQGWPGNLPLPEKFNLHAAVIQEPDEAGTEGKIFLWATRLTDGEPADEPRAYVLDYDKPLHQKLEAAIRRLRNGNIQIGTRQSPDSSNAIQKAMHLGSKSQQIDFSDLADPALPEK